MNSEILRIGRVIEVNGSKTIGELEASIDDLYRTHKSRKYTIGQIGSILKIESGDLLIFGILTSLRMEEMDGEIPNRNIIRDPSSKWIEIELFGQGYRVGLNEGDFEFERGVSTYPLPGQSIYLATVDELRRIYSKPNKPTVKVGSIAQATALPAHLLVNEMLGRHLAILGTTGAGKSCAVALILQSILREYSNAHILLLDPHNEYFQAFPDDAIRIDLANLQLPHWLLNFEESIELFIGKTEFAATRQTNILKDAILDARKKFSDPSKNLKITVDTPIPYKISDLKNHIEAEKLKAAAASRESYEKIISKLTTLQEDKRFEFLMRPDDKVEDNLGKIVSTLFRIPSDKKPLAIVDISGIPSEVVDVAVSVLCRIIFDFTLWNPRRIDMPLLLVCEEAHRYVPESDEAAFQPTKRAISRIAKEGRKYGVSLALVSQRPSELSESIISQCNTIIALRMSNDKDQQFVRNALPDSVKSLVDILPALRTREALVVGEGTSIPVRILFDEIPEDKRPRSADVPFATAWGKEALQGDIVKTVIENWREQKRP